MDAKQSVKEKASKSLWNDDYFDMGVSKNRGKTPQIIHFNKVFHYFHHPFWG